MICVEYYERLPRPSRDGGGNRKNRRADGKTMKEGAVGMSTGLKYAPFTKSAEVIAAAKVVARYGGFHMSHIREKGRGVVEAVEELIRISEESGGPGAK